MYTPEFDPVMTNLFCQLICGLHVSINWQYEIQSDNSLIKKNHHHHACTVSDNKLKQMHSKRIQNSLLLDLNLGVVC